MMEFPFEKMAMKGNPLPKGLDAADTCAYISLKNLYAMYYNKLIDRKRAAEEKQTIIYNWRELKSQIEFLSRDCLALKDRIFSASEKYKSDPSVQTADSLYAAFYNLPEEWRTKE